MQCVEKGNQVIRHINDNLWNCSESDEFGEE